MNLLFRIALSLLIVVLGCLATVLLAQPLEGMRGAPWFNFYVFEMPLVWLITTLVVICLLSQGAEDLVATFLGSWIRGGGFWAVLSKNNIPGNTWVVIALVLAFNALTYGPPTPKVDWSKVQHDAKASVQKTIHQPVTQNVISGVKGTVNYLAVGLVGQELIPTRSAKPALAELTPCYQRGWWRIWTALLTLLFAPLIWIWGRRNDLADKVSSLVDIFKEKRMQRGSASSDSGKAPSLSGVLLDKLVRQTDQGGQVINHMFGEFLARGVESLFGGCAKLMKRY